MNCFIKIDATKEVLLKSNPLSEAWYKESEVSAQIFIETMFEWQSIEDTLKEYNIANKKQVDEDDQLPVDTFRFIIKKGMINTFKYLTTGQSYDFEVNEENKTAIIL